MVDRSPHQELTRTNGLSKIRGGSETKQENQTVIQALSAANRELSDREHEDIIESEDTDR